MSTEFCRHHLLFSLYFCVNLFCFFKCMLFCFCFAFKYCLSVHVYKISFKDMTQGCLYFLLFFQKFLHDLFYSPLIFRKAAIAAAVHMKTKKYILFVFNDVCWTESQEHFLLLVLHCSLRH